MDAVDVVIIGAGPAGLTAQLCLTKLGFSVLCVDANSERTQTGKADGLQPRTLEVLRNISPALHNDLTQLVPSYKLYACSFFDADEQGNLYRSSRHEACPDDSVQDRYTLMTHQGHIESALMRATNAISGATEPDTVLRNYAFAGFSLSKPTASAHPVSVTLDNVCTGEQKQMSCKYLLGADGAKSGVRAACGIPFQGSSSESTWSVIDATLDTDFPDIRIRSMIRSAHGTIMTLPREDGISRFYVQLQGMEREQATSEAAIAQIKRVFQPYRMDIKSVVWQSSYTIGQRVATSYTAHDYRILLLGDACHCHSPKSGQGMNFAISDALSLAQYLYMAEKLGHHRELMLQAYEDERRGAAMSLIKFDQLYASLVRTKSTQGKDLIPFFAKNQGFTTGCAIRYDQSAMLLNDYHWLSAKKSQPSSAEQLTIGQRLLRAPACQLYDRTQSSLEHAVLFDGSFRLYLFSDSSRDRLSVGAIWLSSEHSFLQVRSKSSVRIKIVAVLPGEAEFDELPEILRQRQDGAFKSAQAFQLYGISPQQGAIPSRI
ncbi:uncharacterized protein L969DRAFT_20950 [Mixia osmundae IAM 14324]|uniref:uncharacterized protein n=1 Tax=Mixia osmundae (strain CBS 9802 / IAM 14324 / JCM 22182 / KY 12970) TaxID=764103 RepID=UPI0004A54A8C|nr:uncharacterized protein L969DRAFT_20950 [Mixia osmundae IAM 14324]KEI42039.1 hypothetical protein L969DRAFT_20950 [Mixia osmundae IAM 14324]